MIFIVYSMTYTFGLKIKKYYESKYDFINDLFAFTHRNIS